MHRFYAIIHLKVGDCMKWREQVKYYIDFTFDLVKNQYEDIMFPCYGGRFYRFLLNRYYERSIYFYLTNDALIYTPSGATFTEIPFHEISNLKVWQKGNKFHIKFTADKKYHFQLYVNKWLVTEKVGNLKDNTKKFIEELESKVKC